MSSLMVSPHSPYPGCSSGSCWISPGLCPQPGDGQTPCWAPAASSAEARWTAAASRPAPSTACLSQSGTPAPVTVTMVTNKLQVIFTALHSACPHLSICVCEHAWVRACHVHAECVSVCLSICLHCYERIFDSKPLCLARTKACFCIHSNHSLRTETASGSKWCVLMFVLEIIHYTLTHIWHFWHTFLSVAMVAISLPSGEKVIPDGAALHWNTKERKKWQKCNAM